MRVCLFITAVTIGILTGGCWESSNETGYLSDYSNLQEVSGIQSVEGSTFRYSDTSSVFVKGKYKAFILDPVIVQFQKDGKAATAQSKGKLKGQDVNDLIAYFYSSIIDAVNDSGYKIVYKAGAGIGRIRVAITDLTKTNIVFAAVPTARITTGFGRGGAAIESEMVDSVSGKQITASMESTPGSRIPFTGLSDWGGAKHAMDEWVAQLRRDLKQMKVAQTQS
jgi:hypothetical protein